MLEELHSKIEEAHGRLVGLSDDIKRMQSIEDALVETDQSIASSANALKSFVEATTSSHQSLIDVADAFKDAANTLETIDVAKLSETINASNDRVRTEIVRTGAKSKEELDSVARLIVDNVAESSKEVSNNIASNQENTQQKLETIENRVNSSIEASHTAMLKQIESSAAEMNKTTRRELLIVKLFGGSTLLVLISVLVITVLILLRTIR